MRTLHRRRMPDKDTAKRNRSDHVLPQGYLAGFTDPTNDGQVCVFDRQQQRWFETGTAAVGAIKGFYDYSEGSQPDRTADQAFEKLEGEFPAVRRELVANRFSGWRKHLDLLLRFAQMLQVRSQLFREHDVTQGRQRPILQIVEVVNPTTIKVAPYAPESKAEHETLLRNLSITNMRTEITHGAAHFSQLHWCLRFTTDSSDPVITADNAVVVEGRAATLLEAFRDRETLVFFPLCSQACLIGSPAKFDKKRAPFDPRLLRHVREVYVKSTRRFVYSPVRLAFDGADQQ